MHLMLLHDEPGDYVVATGRAHSVRELCEIAFSHLGLDYRQHVVEDTGQVRVADPQQRVGDAGKARQVLGWRPRMDFGELVRSMVDADMEALSRTPA
jgi:GDPmannose 4,6-dehydratase